VHSKQKLAVAEIDRAVLRMRILIVIPSLASRDGGPCKAAIEECRFLLRRGEDAEIYTTNVDGDDCLDVPLAQPVEVGGIRVTYFPVNGGHYFKFSTAMAAALKANIPHYDILHINSLYQFPSTTAAHYCRKFKVPYILRPHGTLAPYLYGRHKLRKRIYELLIERRNLAKASAVHFTTEEEMDLARSHGLLFQGVEVPLGIEIEDDDSANNNADLLWPELSAKKVVLFLGRMNFVKGLDVLAAAFGEVRRSRSDAHLFLAGPDTVNYASKVREWIGNEGALEAATFAGAVVGSQKSALLKRADMFVLSSYSENFGIAVVEAMAAGLPVVISNRVNIWREVHEAGAGLVVEPNAHEVAAAILKLLADPSLAKQMGKCGRRLVRKRFTWDVAGERLLELCRQIVDRSSANDPMSAASPQPAAPGLPVTHD
jgi:glycosyltransferase involved in cell wall biosynthesis